MGDKKFLFWIIDFPCINVDVSSSQYGRENTNYHWKIFNQNAEIKRKWERNISPKSWSKNDFSTYPPDNSVAIKNKNIDFIQKLWLRVAQFQYVCHVKGSGRRCEGTSKWSCSPSDNCWRKVVATAKCNYIAGCCKQWRSQKKFSGGSCQIHCVRKSDILYCARLKVHSVFKIFLS